MGRKKSEIRSNIQYVKWKIGNPNKVKGREDYMRLRDALHTKSIAACDRKLGEKQVL
jgi:hypothetical protein